MGEFLKPGDPCPCCGMPIKTEGPDKLLVLNWLAWVMGMQKKRPPRSRGGWSRLIVPVLQVGLKRRINDGADD